MAVVLLLVATVVDVYCDEKVAHSVVPDEEKVVLVGQREEGGRIGRLQQ
jgi:hypothetical protein